jgi:hypothetical protein
MRARGDDGYSSLHLFHVVPLPVVMPADGEATGKVPRLLTSDCCVAGILAEGEVHRFQVNLRKGQRVVAEAVGMRAGAAFLDTQLELVAPSGEKVAEADDSPLSGQDSILEAMAREDGPHVISLKEANLGGSDNGFYMLHVGGFPRPMQVRPLGAQPGASVSFRFTDVRGPRLAVAGMPASVPPHGTFELFVSEGSGMAPTPNPVRVTGHAIEEELPKASRPATAPVAFHGVIESPGESDSRRFQARQGETLLVEAWARRLGTPLEPVLDITDANGRVLCSSDDDEGHDSRIRFTPPSSGTYSVRIRDQRGQGSPDHAYRVEVGADRKTLECFLPRPNRLSQERQTVVVPSGGRSLVIFGVRRGELEGEVTMAGSGLPAGVKATPAAARPGEFRIPCVMEAPAVATPAGSLARFGVIHQGREQGRFRQAVDLVAESADTLYRGVELDSLAVAVGSPSPVAVELEAPKAGLPVDGSIAMRAKITRASGFTGAVEVLLPLLPPWVEGPEIVKVPAGVSSAEFTLTALPGATPAEWPLVVEARSVERAEARSCSRFVTLRIIPRMMASPPVDLVVEQGGKARFNLPLGVGLPAAASARILELPPRVNAAESSLDAGKDRVLAEAVVGADGPAGEHRNIVCAIAMLINGERVTQFVGRGSTLRIEKAGTRAVGPDGKPLSRLEQLRAKAASADSTGKEPK